MALQQPIVHQKDSLKTLDYISVTAMAGKSILYSVIAHGTSVLCKYARCAGNFAEVTEFVLAEISPDQPRLSYSHGNYLYHYVYEDEIIYLCITDENFDRYKAFNFLNEIKRRFQSTYGTRALTALPYAMNSEFSRVLASQMKHFSESSDVDRLTKVKGEVDELTEIMVQNIDNLANRGEKLELLVDKTENLTSSSVTFRKTSQNLARSMCIKNVKITVITILVMIVILYIIVSASCGGLAWPSCV
ncbi:hypothetical protein JTE90_012107 [Oedothorax gibbosus]|uniref:Vesicle-associated membrane protein 7 n=1 Tax=Oedothorax gibbosus TaxID=931172 RepID=A0AAV6UX40_9ARAC|nr:hypothetical protein JTE90_012107 [Oedothorax gibbosus]